MLACFVFPIHFLKAKDACQREQTHTHTLLVTFVIAWLLKGMFFLLEDSQLLRLYSH